MSSPWWLRTITLAASLLAISCQLLMDKSEYHQAHQFGFTDVNECPELDKAFLCLRQCLFLGYDFAHSNGTCACTCHYIRKHELHNSFKHRVNKYDAWLPTTRAFKSWEV